MIDLTDGFDFLDDLQGFTLGVYIDDNGEVRFSCLGQELRFTKDQVSDLARSLLTVIEGEKTG